MRLERVDWQPGGGFIHEVTVPGGAWDRRTADELVAVIPALALSWHAVELPKAPAGRMRAALEGLLEEQLLDEPQVVHAAVELVARIHAHAAGRARLLRHRSAVGRRKAVVQPERRPPVERAVSIAPRR